MLTMDFDRCIQAVNTAGIWMVREKSKSKVKFSTWEDYVSAGTPAFEVVTAKELAKYRVAGQFRPLFRE